MPRVSLLDDKSAQHLNAILDQFYNEVEAGAPPTEVLRKLAADHNLTPNYIRLLGRAYNSGMTNYFIHGVKKADGVYKFPLCDPEDVVKSLFNVPVKKKSSSISTDFATDPEKLNLTEKPTPTIDIYPKTAQFRSIDSIQKEAVSIYRDVLKKRAEYETMMHGWAVGLDSALGELAHYFQTGPCASPIEVKFNAEACGYPAAALLKKAGVTETPRPWHVTGRPVNWTSPPYSLIKRATECLQRFQQVKQFYNRLDEECRKIESRFDFKMSMPPVDLPLLDGPIAKALLTRVMKSAQQHGSDSRSERRHRGGRRGSSGGEDGRGFRFNAREIVTSTLSGAGTVGRSLYQSYFKNLPKQFEQGHALHQEDFIKTLVADNSREILILLTDYMMNDPIIAQFDPDDVLRTFKEITALAPHIVAQPDVLRSTLRKTLAAGGLEPIDVKMLVDLDKRLGTRAQAMSNYYGYHGRDDDGTE